MTVKPIPDGFHTVTPYLVVKGVPELIEFMCTGLGGELLEKNAMPDGAVMHAQVKVGDSIVMMGEAQEGSDPMPAFLYLYVTDTDALYNQALSAGATSVQEPKDEFYGDRTSGVKDASGNMWWIATHQEDLSTEEVNARAAAARGDSEGS